MTDEEVVAIGFSTHDEIANVAFFVIAVAKLAELGQKKRKNPPDPNYHMNLIGESKTAKFYQVISHFLNEGKNFPATIFYNTWPFNSLLINNNFTFQDLFFVILNGKFHAVDVIFTTKNGGILYPLPSSFLPTNFLLCAEYD